jgi:hypothetical protein
MNYLKDRGNPVVRLGRRIGKNGSRHWVSVEGGDEMKNKIKNIDLPQGI